VFVCIGMATNPYYYFAASLAQLVEEAKSLPSGNIPPHHKSRPSVNAPVVLVFSPHPDDDHIIGGLALRLLREAGMHMVKVAVTLGSKVARQQERWQELKNASPWLGFDLERTAPNGLEKIQFPDAGG